MFLAAGIIFFNRPAYSDTEVIPATGGSMCVGGGYVTLGDITVKENDPQDFEKDKPNRNFILVLPSSNFEFKAGAGTVEKLLGSASLTINSVTVTTTQITINYSMDDEDDVMDGFTIKGIQVRAVGSADYGHIRRQEPPSPGHAKQKENEPPDKVSHGFLKSSAITAGVVSLSSNDADNTICAGQSVTFTASMALATNYEFFVNGITVQNGASDKYTTTSLTNGQKVSVIARVLGSCSTGSSSEITMTVHPLPVVTLTSNKTGNSICTGEGIIFTASPALASNYEFFVDGISKQNNSANTFSPDTLTNNQVVTDRVTNANGCAATSADIVVKVNPLPVVGLASNDMDNKICAGQSITFTASPAGASKYEFYVGGILKQSGASE